MNEAYRAYLIREYVEKERSTYEIAEERGTYPNRIRRDLKKLNIERRSKSKAQSIAIKQGRHKHPTKGSKRSEQTKVKISEKVAQIWDAMDEATKQKRIALAKAQWDNMSTGQQEEFRRLAAEAVRKAADEGSKLEKFLLLELRQKGYNIVFHKEHSFSQESLQLDIYLPKLKTAIEVDGPAHFFPIWGEVNLAKHIVSDNRKTGLVLNAGYVLIRVKHLAKTMSKIQERRLLHSLLLHLSNIEKMFPIPSERLIEIEVK